MRGIRLTSVVLPDPVGPTIARLVPAGIRRFSRAEPACLRKLKLSSAEFDLARDLAILRAGNVLDLRLLLHDFVDSNQRRSAALEDVDDPAQSDHRPRELHHVSAERNELTDAHRTREIQRGRHSGSWDSEDAERSCRIRNQRHGGESVDDFAAAQPQHEYHSATQHEFQRGPEHAHETHQSQAARGCIPGSRASKARISASSCT